MARPAALLLLALVCGFAQAQPYWGTRFEYIMPGVHGGFEVADPSGGFGVRASASYFFFFGRAAADVYALLPQFDNGSRLHLGAGVNGYLSVLAGGAALEGFLGFSWPDTRSSRWFVELSLSRLPYLSEGRPFGLFPTVSFGLKFY